MSLIKLEVNVNADNALVVAEFIKSLAGCTADVDKVARIEVKDAEELKPEELKKQPAKRASRAKKPEPVEEDEGEDIEDEIEDKNEEAQAITADDLRALQATKVGAHRDDIIAKFKTLGAKSIATLEEDHFEEYYNFLAKLK
jgi:hypothetical protein